jgi:transcriptional antiterminator NusG
LSHRWYVVNTHSGFEKKVSQVIEEQAERKGLADHFSQVLVPMEEVIEIRRGKKVNAERKFFPGYILINMDMTDDTWHLVKDTPKVSGFLGPSGKPSPISEAEAQAILSQVQEGVDKPKRSIIYQIGETIKVADGPFASFNGVVEDIDEEKERLKIAVSIFGRSTLVELGYGQVEKA